MGRATATASSCPFAMPSVRRGGVFFFVYFFMVSASFVAAQQQQQQQQLTDVGGTPPDVPVSFRPSVAIVIGIFSIMFSLTFLLLIYAKFCHSPTSEVFGTDAAGVGGFLLPQYGRFSGIDKSVIESLPLFRFSALRGVRDGLECAVCLSRFDDAGDVLRLLPKCKHAFHVGCVDRWLQEHSSCPLCRCKVNAEDVDVFKFSASARFLFTSDRLENSGRDLELFVERELDDDGAAAVDGRGSSRFNIYGWRKAPQKSKEEKKADDLSTLAEGGSSGGDTTDQFYHKFKHRIIFSDVVLKGRWSDVNSSDLMSLNSDMLNLASSKRFAESDPAPEPATKEGKVVAAMDEKVLKIKEELEKKRLLEMKASQINRGRSSTTTGLAAVASANFVAAGPTASISSGRRSMSEITNLSRFKLGRDSGGGGGGMLNGSRDEKVTRLWLPIARRTVQWFAGRERRSEAQNEHTTGSSGGGSSSSSRGPANV